MPPDLMAARAGRRVWVCPCGAQYAAQVRSCHRCGTAGQLTGEEAPPRMAKNTVHAGVTDRHAGPGETGHIPDDDFDEGGEGVSPGTSSSGSSKTPDGNTTSGPADGPKRARTTASPSNRGRGGRSTAGSTDSPGRTTG